MPEITIKGAIAGAAITAAAVELGFVVLRPVVEGRRYDLVIDTGPELPRVQCRWAQRKGSVILVYLSTCRHTPSGYAGSTYGPDEVDGIAVYCHESNVPSTCRSKQWPVARGSICASHRRLTTRRPR